jgi:hypothetical protein
VSEIEQEPWDGFHDAFWTLGQVCGWPRGIEITLTKRVIETGHSETIMHPRQPH